MSSLSLTLEREFDNYVTIRRLNQWYLKLKLKARHDLGLNAEVAHEPSTRTLKRSLNYLNQKTQGDNLSFT